MCDAFLEFVAPMTWKTNLPGVNVFVLVQVSQHAQNQISSGDRRSLGLCLGVLCQLTGRDRISLLAKSYSGNRGSNAIISRPLNTTRPISGCAGLMMQFRLPSLPEINTRLSFL
jgi:hypothetical protein